MPEGKVLERRPGWVVGGTQSAPILICPNSCHINQVFYGPRTHIVVLARCRNPHLPAPCFAAPLQAQSARQPNLKNVQSVREMDAYVIRWGSTMDSTLVAAAILKLVKWPIVLAPAGSLLPEAEALLRRLQDMLNVAQPGQQDTRLQLMNSRGLSNLIWSFVKAKIEDGPSFQLVVARLCQDNFSAVAECNAHDLSNIALGVGKPFDRHGGVFGCVDLSPVLMVIARAWLTGAGRDGNAQDVANFMWALAKTGHLAHSTTRT